MTVQKLLEGVQYGGRERRIRAVTLGYCLARVGDQEQPPEHPLEQPPEQPLDQLTEQRVEQPLEKPPPSLYLR